jgi:hypothetical protein
MTTLIGDEPQGPIRLGQPQHGLCHVRADAAAHPRRPHDRVSGDVYRVLAGELRLSVRIDRTRGITFDVRRRFGAVEHVVGREDDDERAACVRGIHDHAHTLGVHLHCVFEFGFTPIDGCERGAVHDRVRRRGRDVLLHRVT